MAGTLFGIPLSQNVDINGRPLSGAFLFVYNAGTLTPANVYTDSSLAVLQTVPLVADAAGRIPQFWVADGTYRARLTDSNLVLIYDIDNVLAIGPSTGTGGGGGGTVTNGFTTGDMIWIPISGTRTGFVRANGRTIGSASSAATERANSDTNGLYAYLWNNFPDGTCPVSGGRGASATADFGNNKPIQLLSMRGRGPFGLDDMGNSAAGIITGGTTAFGTGGNMTSTILQTHLPNLNLSSGGLTVNGHTHGTGSYTVNDHNHFAGSYVAASHNHGITDTGHTHSYTSPNNDHNTSISGGQQTSGIGVGATSGSSTTGISINNSGTLGVSGNSGSITASTGLAGASGSASPGISGTVPTGGSGTALTTISPYALGTWLISL